MTTGEKLALLRKEKNITQEELADVLGVSRQSISKWEQNRAFPETEKLIKLSEIYNCSIDYLLKNEDKVIEEQKPKTKINKKKVIFTFIWSLVNFVIIPLIFLLPVEKYYHADFDPSDRDKVIFITYIYNFYHQIFKENYWLFFWLPIYLELTTIVLSVFLLVFKKRGFYVVRLILSINIFILYSLASAVMIRSAILSHRHLQIGIFVLLGVKLFNLIGLAVFKFNRYLYLKS